MKQGSNGILTSVTKKEMTDLTTITKETLAADLIKNPQQYRKFGAVDLWNARKNYKTMRMMRRCL